MLNQLGRDVHLVADGSGYCDAEPDLSLLIMHKIILYLTL